MAWGHRVGFRNRSVAGCVSTWNDAGEAFPIGGKDKRLELQDRRLLVVPGGSELSVGADCWNQARAAARRRLRVEGTPGIRQGVGVTDLAVWDISADAAVAAIGAGAAALVAALTAQLRAQLNHDAQMRERHATRERSGRSVPRVVRGAVGGVEDRKRSRSGRCRTNARESVQSLRDRRVPLMAASFRLHLRFPDTDPIIGRLAEWRETFEQLAEDYQAALESSDHEMAERFATAQQTATCLGRG